MRGRGPDDILPKTKRRCAWSGIKAIHETIPRTVISRDLLQIVWNCSRWFWRLEAQGRAIFTGTSESLNFSVRTPWRLPVLAKFACGTADNRSLTPRVSALAATLVGFDTFNAQGHRLLNRHILDAAFMLLVTTAILGPILTERYVPRTVSDLAERSEDALSAERMPVKDSSP